MSDDHGAPCWYELGTNDLTAAQAFYSGLLGWTVQDSGMPGMDYRIAAAPDGAVVAGLSDNTDQPGSPPPAWLVYVAVDSADDTGTAVTAAGGQVLVPGTDIPGTGRFAICTDPQGAAFGVLQPLPMEDGSQGGRAFAMGVDGHGTWHELMTPDPQGAIAFYTALFGWGLGEALDMGADGIYQIITRGGSPIGGVMGQATSPVPVWLPYFGVQSVAAAAAKATQDGGTVVAGPVEVPGGGHIVVASDPQGAVFAVLGGA